MRNAPLLTSLILLAACASAYDGGDYKMYLAKKNVAQPTSELVHHCHAYGCQAISKVELTKADWKKIQKIFKSKSKNAEAERKKIAKAIGVFEQIVGAKDGTDKDVRGTFVESGRYQLDCVDESTNTTMYLALLQDKKLLKFHDVQAPTARVPIIHAGRWPHQTAVIRDIKTGEFYVVDSWFHDNGADAEIIDLKTWKSGWKPESVRDFL